MDYKSLQSYVKAELGVLITMVAVSIMILSNNILMTIPFVIITSFLICLLGVRAWTLYISAIVIHIILGIAIGKWVSIIILPITLIEILGGFLLAWSLKKVIKDWKKPKYIILTVVSLFIVYSGVQTHWGTLGNPTKYIKARQDIQAYINNTYDGNLEIQGIKFSTKLYDYIAEVESIEDRRDEGVLFYGRTGRLSDDYHFRIEENQSLQAKRLILGMIIQKTDVPISDIYLEAHIDLPYNKYSPRDMYLGEEPIFLGIEIKPGNIEDKSAYKEKYGKLPERQNYKDTEAFSKEAYKIIKILKEIDYPYDQIVIESFLPDGERTYNITINGQIQLNSLQDVVDTVQIVNNSK